MGKRAMALGLVMAAVLALGACGDNTKRLTATELTTKGNAICLTFSSEVKKIADTFPASVDFTPAQKQDFYHKLLTPLAKAISDFKALTPPKKLAKTYDAAMKQIDIDRQTLEGAGGSQEAAQRLYETGVDPFAATGQKLAAAGITACGGEPPAASTSVPAATSTTAAK
ncbi:MAG TPA: hypothetical protein VFJ85_14860 [Acidimicrobiales bacterium]|nr:hypothetical protein [Acidimicrobiales bacterium]